MLNTQLASRSPKLMEYQAEQQVENNQYKAVQIRQAKLWE
jgi:hypothetical protein